MPDNAPVDDDHEVQIDFRAYNTSKMAMLTTSFGLPGTSTVLITASESDGQLQVSLASDVSEDPAQAMTATIEYLEEIVSLLRMDGASEASWAEQFDLQDPEEREI